MTEESRSERKNKMSFEIGPVNMPLIQSAQEMMNNGGGGNLGYFEQKRKKKKKEDEKDVFEFSIGEGADNTSLFGENENSVSFFKKLMTFFENFKPQNRD